MLTVIWSAAGSEAWRAPRRFFGRAAEVAVGTANSPNSQSGAASRWSLSPHSKLSRTIWSAAAGAARSTASEQVGQRALLKDKKRAARRPLFCFIRCVPDYLRSFRRRTIANAPRPNRPIVAGSGITLSVLNESGRLKLSGGVVPPGHAVLKVGVKNAES